MENHNPTEKTVPVQFVRGSRAFKQFKNPPQPHMCIQDTIKDTTEKLFINVLAWQKIANTKQYSDPIPLYGGMQVPQGGPNTNKPQLLVFAVMVNPDILKINGKNAANSSDREALVSLLCDFVEAMNPGLSLTRCPVIMKDRDLTGELKDVWLAVQNKREREKGMTQDVMYKVYDIDGVGLDELGDEEKANSPPRCPSSPTKNDKKAPVKSSKQILMNAGQKSEFDSGMNNCQLSLNCSSIQGDTTYCTPVYGQIVSTRENHNEINDIHQKFTSDNNPTTSFKKDWNNGDCDEHSKNETSLTNGRSGKQKKKVDKCKTEMNNGKPSYDFYPKFDKHKTASDAQDLISNPETKLKINDNSKIIIDPMQKLVLHSTDNIICDNKSNPISSIGT